MSNSILKIEPLIKKISFIIHLNNVCNFKCIYCTAGHQTSSDKLLDSDIYNVILSIKKIREGGDNRIVCIDLTGGEPSLDKNLIKYVKEFLKIDNLELQVTTNLFLIENFEEELRLLDKKTLNNFNFNISYHYFEYKGKEDKFIEGIKLLNKLKLRYTIKLLLPDSNESLNDYLAIKNNILNKLNLNQDNIKEDLIINTLGNVSESYSKSILNYFNNTEDNNIEDNNIEQKIDKSLKITYENGI